MILRVFLNTQRQSIYILFVHVSSLFLNECINTFNLDLWIWSLINLHPKQQKVQENCIHKCPVKLPNISFGVNK